jgi:quercetin dioxygenase-like cupin family protein
MPTDLNIAARVKALLDSLQNPALARFLAEWPPGAVRRAVAAATLPVLRWLPDIAVGAAAFSSDLVAAVCREASTLAWRQTYTANELDAAFLDNYGWAEILGVSGPWESERIACGLLILGPSTHYPRHRHEAEEVYLPLSGTAAWQQGNGEFRERPPGSVIHHAREEPHAMRTGVSPLLALYLWRSANLAQKARLESERA